MYNMVNSLLQVKDCVLNQSKQREGLLREEKSETFYFLQLSGIDFKTWIKNN